jgi:hypothetical protein
MNFNTNSGDIFSLYECMEKVKGWLFQPITFIQGNRHINDVSFLKKKPLCICAMHVSVLPLPLVSVFPVPLVVACASYYFPQNDIPLLQTTFLN